MSQQYLFALEGDDRDETEGDPACRPLRRFDARVGASDPKACPQNSPDGPPADRVRGRCPECGEALVSNLYYVGGKGYLLVWECWASLADVATCHYRRVI